MTTIATKNPFRPGAGHLPPYLSGRIKEVDEFKRLLEQDVILENLVITGLRGLGKTVLLEYLKPIAIEANWFWSGTDLSEATTLTEENLAIRIITDLSIVTSNIIIKKEQIQELGFMGQQLVKKESLNYDILMTVYKETPGLVSDRLKAVLELAWEYIHYVNKRGVIFAYDEAQNLDDQSDKGQYSLSLLLDVFQSIQRKNIPFMLVLSGLPTLFPTLVGARTYAERMFRVLYLDQLNTDESQLAITEPLKEIGQQTLFNQQTVSEIVKQSGGYPYFVQFICREAFDAIIQQPETSDKSLLFMDEISHKLDNDFFFARWSRITDRQRDLLIVIAYLDDGKDEFTISDIVENSKKTLPKGFGPAQTTQILSALSKDGLIYKSRHGKYSFAIPLLKRFIQRIKKGLA